MFKRLGFLNYQLFEVEIAESEIEHKAPNIDGIFVLQYANLRRLEL